MDIRPARDADIRDVASLWAEAFPGRRTVEDRIRMLEAGGRYGGLETVLVARDGSRLAGAAKLYALTQHITGSAVPMMGLAAVAVAPALRRRGIAAALCGAAVDAAVARGDVVSVLYPFRPDYYERLGWGLVGRLVDHRFATSALPPHPESSRVRRARLPGDVEGIAGCYAAVAARGHGPIARDRRVWGYRLAGEELGVRPLEEATVFADDPRKAVLVHDDGGIAGYALVRFVDADEPSRRAVVVRELVAATDAAYRGLLGSVAGLATDWPRARHFSRPEERFADRLRDPRPPGRSGARSLYFATGRILRGPMLRILDMRAALSRRRWFDGRVPAPQGGAAFTVSVRDDLRPENHGDWSVRVGSGGQAVSVDREPAPGRGPAARRGGRLATDIATFGRIWAGDLAPTEAVALGRATTSGAGAGAVDRDLDAAFATRESFWLLDEF